MADLHLRPPTAELTALGVDAADAEHVADAIGMGCGVFLTNDHKLRRRWEVIQAMSGLRVLLPSEFLMEAVRGGAPWPVRVPWPWEIPPAHTKGAATEALDVGAPSAARSLFMGSPVERTSAGRPGSPTT